VIVQAEDHGPGDRRHGDGQRIGMASGGSRPSASSRSSSRLPVGLRHPTEISAFAVVYALLVGGALSGK